MRRFVEGEDGGREQRVPVSQCVLLRCEDLHEGSTHPVIGQNAGNGFRFSTMQSAMRLDPDHFGVGRIAATGVDIEDHPTVRRPEFDAALNGQSQEVSRWPEHGADQFNRRDEVGLVASPDTPGWRGPDTREWID
ncbi:hypothetical protein D3C85_1114610 [compost metagenome]